MGSAVAEWLKALHCNLEDPGSNPAFGIMFFGYTFLVRIRFILTSFNMLENVIKCDSAV